MKFFSPRDYSYIKCRINAHASKENGRYSRVLGKLSGIRDSTWFRFCLGTYLQKVDHFSLYLGFIAAAGQQEQVFFIRRLEHAPDILSRHANLELLGQMSQFLNKLMVFWNAHYFIDF